jgi:ubiquinone/menaquinone biosynthesis C-methylase UbiE
MSVAESPRSSSNPFADPEVVAGYETWYESKGFRSARLEKSLLKRLVVRFPKAHTLLEVGCGTGHFTRWFRSQQFQTVGLDLSWPMLSKASHMGSTSCICGDALALPFLAGSFDLVALITTLEFLLDSVHALDEALRVARQGLVLGVLNRKSELGRRLKNKGGPVWEAARFYTPRELLNLVCNAGFGKQAKVFWRTTLWPFWPRALPLPWGGFIGAAVTLT